MADTELSPFFTTQDIIFMATPYVCGFLALVFPVLLAILLFVLGLFMTMAIIQDCDINRNVQIRAIDEEIQDEKARIKTAMVKIRKEREK